MVALLAPWKKRAIELATVLALLSSDDQLVTAAAVKDGTKVVLDVDPMTGIVLPHVDMPPIPAQLAPVTGLPANRR